MRPRNPIDWIVDALQGAKLTTPKDLAKQRTVSKGPFWCTSQVYFDENGKVLQVLPMTVDGKVFSLRVRREGKDVIAGFHSMEDQEGIERLLMYNNGIQYKPEGDNHGE